MKKRIISLLLGTVLMTGLFVGCGANGTTDSGTDTQNEASADGESYTIGIGQFALHPSLDNCREGFLEGLAENGIVEGENLTVDYQNANADTSIANQIAQSFAADNNDLVCGIATPIAMAEYNACSAKGTPVIFTAVTDPISAQLANEDGTPVGEVTGTSDKLAIDAQLNMIREFMPDAKKIGIIYSTSETNSVSAIEEYKQLAPNYGFEIVESGISQSSDIPLAAADIVSKVDCISNLTDNTVVESLQTLLDAANNANIPVFGSEIEQVKNGCVASEGIDYVALGKQTGAMAAKVLKGEAKASELNYETISEYKLYINNDVLANFGLTVPDSLADGAIDANTVE
jgi:putative ABC transport system substrate-binding protein